jgi:hypothetical protein
MMLAWMLTMALGACVAQPGEFYLWGDPGNGLVYGEAVPDGERWIVRAAGITSTAGNQAEYMLMISHPVAALGGPANPSACCWFIPVQRGIGKPDGTPTLALDHEVSLIAGEKFMARANGLRPDDKIALAMVFWRLPARCAAPTGYAP